MDPRPLICWGFWEKTQTMKTRIMSTLWASTSLKSTGNMPTQTFISTENTTTRKWNNKEWPTSKDWLEYTSDPFSMLSMSLYSFREYMDWQESHTHGAKRSAKKIRRLSKPHVSWPIAELSKFQLYILECTLMTSRTCSTQMKSRSFKRKGC